MCCWGVKQPKWWRHWEGRNHFNLGKDLGTQIHWIYEPLSWGIAVRLHLVGSCWKSPMCVCVCMCVCMWYESADLLRRRRLSACHWWKLINNVLSLLCLFFSVTAELGLCTFGEPSVVVCVCSCSVFCSRCCFVMLWFCSLHLSVCLCFPPSLSVSVSHCLSLCFCVCFCKALSLSLSLPLSCCVSLCLFS